MTRQQANRILDLQRTGEADFSRITIERALHATGDIPSEWARPRRVVTAEGLTLVSQASRARVSEVTP